MLSSIITRYSQYSIGSANTEATARPARMFNRCSLCLRCRCLLYQLCFHRQAFEDGAKLSIINGNFVIPETDVTHVMFHDLIRQTLAVDPEFRYTIQQT